MVLEFIAAGLALGALLGGVLPQAWGWEAVFRVNVPLAGACALAARYWIPADGARACGRNFDISGALTVTVTVGGTLQVFALVQGPEWGWAAPSTLGCVAWRWRCSGCLRGSNTGAATR